MQATIYEEAGIIAEGSIQSARSSQNPQSQDASASIAETEYSLALSVFPERVGQYISAMARLLQSSMPPGPLDDSTLQGLEQELPDMLKTFALKMGHFGSTPEDREIMYFVYKYRDSDGDFDKEEEEGSRPVIGHAQPMTQDDIVSRYLANLDTRIGPELEPSSRDDDVNEEHGVVSHEPESSEMPDIGKYQDCIVKSAAYEWLQRTLSAAANRANAFPDVRKEIRETVIRSLCAARGERTLSRSRPPELYRVTAEMDWDPRSFVAKQEYEENRGDAIARAVTLTGSTQDCQAMTTRQYLSQTWSSSGSQTMQLLQRVLAGEPGDVQSTTWPDRTTVTAWTSGSTFFVTAIGLAPSIAEIIEQVAWLGAALRPSPREQGVCYCTPSVKPLRVRDNPSPTPPEYQCYYQISFEFGGGGRGDHANGQCWHGMFRNPVVVRGYPLARRTATQTGLEMPLNMMACMVRATHVVPFASSWYIKGFSSMLALAELRDDIFLWHHVYDRDGGRVSYFDHKSPNPPLGIITASALQNARHVVGWCSDVKLYAGALSNTNLNISDSGLDRPRATCVLEKVSISGGKFITGGASVAIGVRESPIHLSRDSYLDKMRWVSGQYAILWDEGDDRGWLVNGASALLHLVCAAVEDDLKWMRKCGLQSDQILFKREDVEGSALPHTPGSALNVLVNPRNRELKVVVNDTTYTRFKHLVEKQYRALEQIMDHQFQIEDRSGLDLKCRARKWLEGWDFRDLAVTIKTGPIYARLKTLQTIARGWVDFAREIKAITIFGKGFGEIIRPTNATSMCAHWARVPAGRYYLAACVSDLKAIMRLEDGDGRSKNPIRICNGLHWHVREGLFQPCRCGKASIGRTKVTHSEDVAQVLAPSRMIFGRSPTSASSSVELKDAGAVVFGYSPFLGLIWPDVGSPEEGEV
ncbi:hypothetical protein B0H63DRAFT_387983, partial [Podospora didyma]